MPASKIPSSIIVLSGSLFLHCVFPISIFAQVSFVARFEMEKQRYLAGEPIFCRFVIQNTGSDSFAFRYRSPNRTLSRGLEQEPNFRITDQGGHTLSDPAPKPCGGAQGTVVYGSVTLPSGKTHTERWLLNQWARFTAPGLYQVRAERRLPLLAVDIAKQGFGEKPTAYALVLDEMKFKIVPASESQLRSVYKPYIEALQDPKNDNPAEAVLAVTSMPQPFLLPELESMNDASNSKRWDRRLVLEGLARLGTPAAWDAILKVAQGNAIRQSPASSKGGHEDSLQAYAVLLLAEKGDPSFLPSLLDILPNASLELSGAVLRALGFFQDPRAYQALFDKLHSSRTNDRMNAILGLKNTGSKDVVPALLAMLNDPEAQVRQVANFALRGLTGQRFSLSPKASREESVRVATEWHAWWRAKGASYIPVRQPVCQDW